MKIKYYVLTLSYMISGYVTAQIGLTESDLEFRGSIASNGGDQTEFFGQRRTALWGLSLDRSAKVQVGLSKTRAGNMEIIELPLLYRYQIKEKLRVYGGAQVQFIRGLETGRGHTLREVQTTFGLDYDISPIWDAGVQFVIPINVNADLPNGNFELSQPIRLRTGIKF